MHIVSELSALSTADLVTLFNSTFSKSVKVGSYTRAKMIETLSTAAPIEAPKAAIEFEEGVGEKTYPAPAPSKKRKPTKATAAVEVAPVVEPIAEVPTDPEARLDAGLCPFCGGAQGNQTCGGAEGTWLGDNTLDCHECGKSYNIFDGSEVEVPKETGTKKKRKILNPQVKIDAKVEACAKEGIEVVYEKAARLWIFSDNQTGVILLNMDSRTFSEYTPEELAQHVDSHRQ